ncbi:peptide chain release factor-like protein [Thalassospira xianhensis]|uniref:peptide chain release factor-like protein n=1 Tax=Thalassospira xianhensis TaxID=478503 RepID=UPI00244AEBAD|nr:peptide chain release factor-like protein [Thalassospira xianhensis]
MTVSITSEGSVSPELLLRDECHFRVEWFSGTGNGGQHRNKHQNSCRVFHVPTGLCEARQGRKRENNLREAKTALIASLEALVHQNKHTDINQMRRMQIGSGMRGDKVITIRFQDDRTVHHDTGKTMSTKRYLKGFMDEIWL